MFLIIFIIILIGSIGITYFGELGSRIYIDLSRSYASSSYPGDITTAEKLIYQIFFPTLLLVVLLFFTYLVYLIFKNKVKFPRV